MSTTLRFADYKDKLIAELEKSDLASLGINESVTLLDGFINQPIYSELTGNFVIGGPSIPMVALIGKTSSRVYFFALKALLPTLEQSS